MPRRMAMRHRVGASAAPSLSRMFWTCILIGAARGAQTGRRFPCCQSLRRPARAPRFRAGVSAICGKYSLRRSATSGGISRLPACTVRIACTTSVWTVSFGQVAAHAGFERAIDILIAVVAGERDDARVRKFAANRAGRSSMPLSSGIRRSISTTSGCSSRNRPTASRPLSASPIRTRSGSLARIEAMPLRTSG